MGSPGTASCLACVGSYSALLHECPFFMNAPHWKHDMRVLASHTEGIRHFANSPLLMKRIQGT